MPASQSLTILVVDDEHAVRDFIRRQLVALGHTVLEASHGLEALHYVRVQRSIDLVLADVIMPMMNGAELAATLISEAPDLPVVLMSAYVPPDLVRVGMRQTVVPVLVKPFDIDQLKQLPSMAAELRETRGLSSAKR